MASWDTSNMHVFFDIILLVYFHTVYLLEELKAKKIFVQHVETVSSSEAAIDVLKSFMVSMLPVSADESKSKTKIEERRHTFKQGNVLARNARFEQIWRSREGNKETMHDYPLREICNLYDVVRVDNEGKSNKVEDQADTSLEDNTILCNYLPILREFIPSAAAEIESDICAYLSKQASTDHYVYDLYAVKDDLETAGENALNSYPLVQVDDDDDFFDGLDQSEFESDDSNAEDNPLNDYPDEETSEDVEEHESSSSHDEPEEVKSRSASKKWVESEDKKYEDLSEDEDSLSEEHYVDDDNDDRWINAH
ncbi:hypothetical protein HHK36_018641 [Tetracentron sinense]|uniref:Transcription factor Iwr1 domain-containing protein n=1 Tax=Tetracentron sinense TaxID=13715 RepID=A0A835DB05_TETSI|nr:hypothetical protein HHK36_018641 [Tetracentron sinense]